MKILISADIEGVAGIAAWEEARKSSPTYPYFAEQMTKEVAAACAGANAAGASEIIVKDAHGSARNINPGALPQNARVMRGWSGHPHKMIQGLEEDFFAVAFVGYHSYGGSNANPLAHTINSSVINYLKLNGEFFSEFAMHAYLASYLGVPVAFISGDGGICAEAEKLNPNIVTVPVLEGIGAATISLNPAKAADLIQEGMQKALEKDLKGNMITLPREFELEIGYNFHGDAYRNSFYPGARQISPKSILFETNDYFEIMRATSFLI